MNFIKKHFKLLLIFALVTSFFSCSKDSTKDGGAEGYALEEVDGHSFQFYNSKQLLFSVLNSRNDIKVAIGPGKVLYGKSTFIYEKTGDNTAACTIFIPYSYLLVGKTIYGSYSAYSKLIFNSPKGGTYQNYDLETNKQGSAGTFTIDDNNLDFSENSNNPNIPDNPSTPDNPINPEPPVTIPANAIVSKITKVFDEYTKTEDQVSVSYTYDLSIVKKVDKMGHCWSTSPNPTVTNSNVISTLYSNKDNGSVACMVKHAPGTTYYIRAFVQIGTKFQYFNEIKVETLGGLINLSTNYSISVEDSKIFVNYDIKKSGMFELLFGWENNKILDKSFGYVSGKGQRSPGFTHNSLIQGYGVYYAMLKEVSTGITYYSKRMKSS